MKLEKLVCLLVAVPAFSAALADSVVCPDLAGAVQVAACPSEEELRFTFNGFCSDNARMYGKGAELCTDYLLYRRQKNIALWESPDGNFQAYISCDLPSATVRQAKASSITVSRKAGVTNLVCTYREGVVFTYRSRADCGSDVKTDCTADVAGCRATCE